MTACLVLAYNEENYIEDTLSNISSLFDLIIVVNDGSTDKTIEKINNLAFENIKLMTYGSIFCLNLGWFGWFGCVGPGF